VTWYHFFFKIYMAGDTANDEGIYKFCRVLEPAIARARSMARLRLFRRVPVTG
jgi:hypothetical protein